MKKKTMKAIRDLNAYIDDDRQKLCDRLHDVELSHKRMETLLRKVLLFLEHRYYEGHFPNVFVCPDFFSDAEKLHNRIKAELSYPYFRANWKVKGGKKCV